MRRGRQNIIEDEYTNDLLNADYYLRDRQLKYGQPVGHSTSIMVSRPKYKDANWMP